MVCRELSVAGGWRVRETGMAGAPGRLRAPIEGVDRNSRTGTDRRHRASLPAPHRAVPCFAPRNPGARVGRNLQAPFPPRGGKDARINRG